MSDINKFLMLRSLSVTSAGMRAHSEGTLSKKQLESAVLTHYHSVITLDLARHQGGLSGNFTVEVIKERNLNVKKKLNKRLAAAQS